MELLFLKSKEKIKIYNRNTGSALSFFSVYIHKKAHINNSMTEKKTNTKADKKTKNKKQKTKKTEFRHIPNY